MENLKLCEVHYLQGRHRQFKEKVPESLKLQRKRKKKDSNVEIRARKVCKMANMVKKRRKVSESSEALVALKKKGLKLKQGGGDMLELLRMALKKEVEKRKKKKNKKTNEDYNEELEDAEISSTATSVGIVKQETHFTSQSRANEIMSKIEEAAKPLGFDVHKRDYKNTRETAHAIRKLPLVKAKSPSPGWQQVRRNPKLFEVVLHLKLLFNQTI